MKKEERKKKGRASKGGPRREIFPLNEKQKTVRELEELEARLEAQHVSVGAADIWSCNPVHLCDYNCGGGNLCDTHCTCNVVI